MTTTETTEKKTITITMSERRPLKIDPAAWPIIAEAEWADSPYESQATRQRWIRVREHADGRRLVTGGRTSQWQGSRDQHAGYLIDPVRGDDMREVSDGKMTAARPDDDETIRAIRRVGGVIDDDQLAAECIAALPAEEV